MTQFSDWFVAFFELLLKNIWAIIKGIGVGIYNIFVGYPIEYFKSFAQSSKSFGVFDWIMALFFIAIFIILLVVIFIFIVLLIKKYFTFSKVEFDKRDLLYQNNLLERKLRNINFKDSNANQTSANNFDTTPKNELLTRSDRFIKLSNVDEKYKYSKLPTYMTEDDKLTLSQLVEHFKQFSANKLGLFYDNKTIATFISGMGTSKLMVLEGISGTGKTSLPYAFGKFINNDSTIIPVQPSWRDRFEMMGYLNEFTKKFNETEFLRALYEATFRSDINIIVLDEMNLARVEYYFADFLALLELPDPDEWLLEVVPEQTIGDPVNLTGGKIRIPSNVWFVGTANKDDSTFAITDKVYDRAASIEMNNKAEFFESKDLGSINISHDYLETLFAEALEKQSISHASLEALNKLDDFIAKEFEVTFGNRIMKQFTTFIPIFVSCGMTEVEGIDYLIARKIIRKFETLNLPFLKNEMRQLMNIFDQLFGKDKMVDSKAMVAKYMKQI